MYLLILIIVGYFALSFLSALYLALRRRKRVAAIIRADIARHRQRYDALYEAQERAKVQAKEAAAAERREKEQAALRFQREQASADIDFLEERWADLCAQLDYVLLQQSPTLPGSKQHEAFQRRAVTLKNQIHAAETRLSKARYNKERAEKNLSA